MGTSHRKLLGLRNIEATFDKMQLLLRERLESKAENYVEKRSAGQMFRVRLYAQMLLEKETKKNTWEG